jgi:uncharacterized protein YkwD
MIRAIHPTTLYTIAAACLLALGTFSAARGQNSSDRPVARLITSGTSTYERPRRSGETVKSSAKVRTKDSSDRYPSFKEATPIERRAFELTNKQRVKSGLNALAWDPELCYLARVHSEKMARERFFSHVTPEGQRLRDRALAMGIPRFKVIAENIAYNQGIEDPGAFAVERWMISAGHRANILYSEFQTAAVGVFESADGTVYLTQAFIAR